MVTGSLQRGLELLLRDYCSRGNRLMSRERVKEAWQNYWAQQGDHEIYLDEMSKAIISELEDICGSLKGKRVLEAGCGRGIISARMAELGAEVYLLDISEEALKIARKHFIAKNLHAMFLHGDILDLPFRESTFDLVWNAGVMEHFEEADQLRAIQGISKIIKPAGLFITFNPYAGAFFYSIGKKYAEKKGIWPYGPEFPVKSLGEGCRVAGLKVLREYPICFKENLSYLSYVSKHLRSIVKLILLPFSKRFLMKIFGGYLLVTIGVKQQR